MSYGKIDLWGEKNAFNGIYVDFKVQVLVGHKSSSNSWNKGLLSKTDWRGENGSLAWPLMIVVFVGRKVGIGRGCSEDHQEGG